MHKDKKPYRILVIEDNPGDFILVEDYLFDTILTPVIKNITSFTESKYYINTNLSQIDAILLDLTLPDCSGESLLNEILNIAGDIPVIILTGYTDAGFAIKSLKLGASDYLLKDELNPAILYKSIVYNIERKKSLKQLQDSEQRYSELFQFSPLPMWVYDSETLFFLDVNEAAVNKYGYTVEEFKNMKITEIRPEEDIPELMKVLEFSKNKDRNTFVGEFRHRKKNGEIFSVEVTSNIIVYNGRKAEIILANDITDKKKYLNKIESQNTKLKEIAWFQSHIVRTPVSKLLGLLGLILNGYAKDEKMKTELLQDTFNAASDLDKIIKDVVDKTNELDINN
ncbi:MAG TPA: histidine kinase [Bacteroidetes bacterium]|nr:histidine kinase [Bacteroidota bacterium]HCN37617.1 histidine kinase [Bacteroidota bacterium]